MLCFCGPIAPGDPITASSVAGVGMKATFPGMIVGFALDSWSGTGQGSVMATVRPGWWGGGGHQESEDALSATIATDANGMASVAFSQPLGLEKPVVQLTVEGQRLAFAQIAEFTKDDEGRYTGFIIKTFAPSGEPAPDTTVHYSVEAKKEVP